MLSPRDVLCGLAHRAERQVVYPWLPVVGGRLPRLGAHQGTEFDLIGGSAWRFSRNSRDIKRLAALEFHTVDERAFTLRKRPLAWVASELRSRLENYGCGPQETGRLGCEEWNFPMLATRDRRSRRRRSAMPLMVAMAFGKSAAWTATSRYRRARR